MLRLLLADDHMIVLESLFLLFSENPMFMVSGIAESGEQALKFIEENHVDLLVTDVRIGGMSGIELCAKAKEIKPSLQVLILTMIDDPFLIKQAIAVGASGYVLKNTDAEELNRAIGNISCGKRYFSEQVTFGISGLTEQERNSGKIQFSTLYADNY